ncbi:hypothetical protein KJS94_06975 [Flavihumibacter rivuli]|uniref:PssE/Cps14G family polysaccharide biosynthesis glycosyltransferase n=1 Tax=Flavihumibacter rivuli TaxID=2838156 RepID=UPI001BDE450E|nr:PssE/Cps14G family polysaccharide biosynthesis glycosyltransferase [Flavihumibacter rivuli]ULQ57941.1 hypothetical protein KJS94_06975 [Flavihumibacter rivuli]
MIFVTTGTQEPFDRLVKCIDELLSEYPDMTFVVQAMKGEYSPQNFELLDFLSPSRFDEYFKSADLIVAHAGMGTILSALVIAKPIIVIPRIQDFNEHRSDHQVATANKMKEMGYVEVANDENELKDILIRLHKGAQLPGKTIGKYASDSLVKSLRDFIHS